MPSPSGRFPLLGIVAVDAVDASLVLEQVPSSREAPRVSLAAAIRTEVLRERTISFPTLVHLALMPE